MVALTTVAVTPSCAPTRARPQGGRYSLVAPVQAGGDVALHVLHPVMGEVPHQHLPPQIQDFIHDMPQSVEEITFISLGNTQMRRFSGQTRRHGVTTEEQRASPVYPLCAGHSEDRLSINKLSPLALKRTHFSTSFHPVSRCCSPAQESKPNFISQGSPKHTSCHRILMTSPHPSLAQSLTLHSLLPFPPQILFL